MWYSETIIARVIYIYYAYSNGLVYDIYVNCSTLGYKSTVTFEKLKLPGRGKSWPFSCRHLVWSIQTSINRHRTVAKTETMEWSGTHETLSCIQPHKRVRINFKKKFLIILFRVYEKGVEESKKKMFKKIQKKTKCTVQKEQIVLYIKKAI